MSKKLINYKEVYPQNSNQNIKVKIDQEHSPFKILAHPKVIKQFVRGESILPIHIRVGLTNKCNLRCNFCNFHSENEKEFYDAFDFSDSIETEKAKIFVKEFSENGGQAITFCGSGECTIYPGYVDICNKAYECGLKIGLITNGSMLNHEKIFECIKNTHTWVRIGINAGNSSTYELITNYKKDNFNNILAATQKLKEVACSDEFKIGLNFVITMENYLEIYDAANIAKSAKADYIRFEPEFYSALAHETIYNKIDQIIKSLNNANKLADLNFEVSIPKLDRGAMTDTDKIEGDFKTCHYSDFVTALGADGFIYPCPQIHMSNPYRMGTISDGYSLWIHSGKREKWKKINSDRTIKCKTCFYCPQNELLEGIQSGKLNVEEVLKEYEKEFPITIHKEFV